MKLSYVKALAERAVKTFCQTLAALLGAGAVDILSSDGPSLAGEMLDERQIP